MGRSLFVLCLLPLFASLATADEVPPTDCDRFAASNLRDHKSGVQFDKINPSLAIPACEAAVKKYPRSARLLYELGRSYLKGADYVAARTLFERAVESGHAPAEDAIGTMYLNGYRHAGSDSANV